MTIRFGVSPIAWVNDDMPELGGDTPLETVLGDAAAIGFDGIELGGKFPRDPQDLKALLDRFDLALVGGWYGSRLLGRGAEAEIAAMRPHLRLLQALGTDVFVIAETSNAIHGDRSRPLSQAPRLAEHEWRAFGRRLTDVADYLAGEGMRCAYHHHLGTVVERQEDLDRLLAVTGEKVGLTLDTGHAVLGGFDPAETIRRHSGRIVHVHCKDIRPDVFGALARRDGSFLDGVLDGMFTVPGDGAIDFAEVLGALADIGYEGWVVVEAEQDPALADPRQYGDFGLRTLERMAERAGLERIVA
jgi:inosose dehydratase